MQTSTIQEEENDEIQEEELDLEVLSMMTAPEVTLLSRGDRPGVCVEDQRPWAWCRGTRGAPDGRQRSWPRAPGSSGSYEMVQLWETWTQGGRLQGAKARGRGKAMFRIR